MPEAIDGQELAITKTLKEEEPLSLEEIEDLVGKYNRELVGKGVECVVISHRNQPEKVVAISYKGLQPEVAKEIFYLQRIFSTLFPHNFPHFYASFGEYQTGVSEGRKISGTVRERVSRTKREIKYPFSRVLGFCQECLIPVDFDVKGASSRLNLLVGRGGGEYYTDTIKETSNLYPSSKRPGWHLAEVMEYMDEAKSDKGEPLYSRRDKRIVRGSIERLAELDLIKLVEPSEPKSEESKETLFILKNDDKG